MSNFQLVRLSSRVLRRENCVKFLQRNFTTSQILRSETTKDKKTEDEDDLDKPYSYLNSKAANLSARDTRRPPENRPESQIYVVTISLAVFMIYFCILREENDVDPIFDRDLKYYFPNMTDEEFRRAMTAGGNRNVAPPMK